MEVWKRQGSANTNIVTEVTLLSRDTPRPNLKI